MVGVNTEAATATTTPTTEATKTVTCTRCHKEFTAPIKSMKRLCPDYRMTSCACYGARKGKVVVFEGDLVKRLEIEEDYALSHNALYWHPQPYTFQSKSRNDLNNME